jgi:hypothetical protein
MLAGAETRSENARRKGSGKVGAKARMLSEEEAKGGVGERAAEMGAKVD